MCHSDHSLSCATGEGEYYCFDNDGQTDTVCDNESDCPETCACEVTLDGDGGTAACKPSSDCSCEYNCGTAYGTECAVCEPCGPEYGTECNVLDCCAGVDKEINKTEYGYTLKATMKADNDCSCDNVTFDKVPDCLNEQDLINSCKASIVHESGNYRCQLKFSGDCAGHSGNYKVDQTCCYQGNSN